MAVTVTAAWRYRRTTYGTISSVLAAVQIAAAAVLASFGDRDADDPVGLVQRILLLAVGAWFVLTAIRVRGQHEQAHAEAARQAAVQEVRAP